MLDRVRETTEGESWTEFSAMYDGMIHSWLRRHGLQEQDADDVRQEVMTNVFRSIGRFEHNGRPGAFRAWLRTVTSNCLREFWRKNQRRVVGNPDLGELADQLEDDQSRLRLHWNAEHDRYVLDHMLEQLTGRFSEQSVAAFRRIVLNQEHADQVAADLGIKLGAARMAQHRVLKALKVLGQGLIDC